MRISDSNWSMVEAKLRSDHRCVLPLGCTEQHAFLSLSTDSILAEKVSTDAAQPLGLPVFPVLAYGMTPSFTAYPGTVSLSMSTYIALLTDVLHGLAEQGFKKIVIVNGHGGNTPARTVVSEMAGQSGAPKMVWHDWWSAPKTMAKVRQTDPDASHASWMENFPWTRLPGVEQPATKKPMVDWERLRTSPPAEVKAVLGDGSFGGLYQRPDEEMAAIWEVAVSETRDVMESV